MAAFLLQSQSEVVVKETMRFSNLKYSLSGPLQKKFADIWSRWSGFWLVTSVMFRYLFFGTTLSHLQFWNPESSETKFFSRVLAQTHLVAKPDLTWCELFIIYLVHVVWIVLCLAIELLTCLLTGYLLRTCWGFSSYIVYAPYFLSKIQKVLKHSWLQEFQSQNCGPVSWSEPCT